MTFDKAAYLILCEANSAATRYPSFNSRHEGAAVLLEEVDEFWDEIKSNNHKRAIAEAIQVGAMALRFVAEFGAKR